MLACFHNQFSNFVETFCFVKFTCFCHRTDAYFHNSLIMSNVQDVFNIVIANTFCHGLIFVVFILVLYFKASLSISKSAPVYSVQQKSKEIKSQIFSKGNALNAFASVLINVIRVLFLL